MPGRHPVDPIGYMASRWQRGASPPRSVNLVFLVAVESPIPEGGSYGGLFGALAMARFRLQALLLTLGLTRLNCRQKNPGFSRPSRILASEETKLPSYSVAAMSVRNHVFSPALFVVAVVLVPATYWLGPFHPWALEWPTLRAREAPYQVQVFNTDPVILYIRDFLSKDEINHILKQTLVSHRRETFCLLA